MSTRFKGWMNQLKSDFVVCFRIGNKPMKRKLTLLAELQKEKFSI